MNASITFEGLRPVTEFYSPDKELNCFEKVLDDVATKMDHNSDEWRLLKEIKLRQNNGFKCLIVVDRVFGTKLTNNGDLRFKYSKMFSPGQSCFKILYSYAKAEGKHA